MGFLVPFPTGLSQNSKFYKVKVPHGIGTEDFREENTEQMESEVGLIEQSINSRYSLWVQEALSELPDSFTVTDPCISGQPIVFASKGFLKMMGYSKSEVIGKNGRIFQGPATCRRSVMEIREAIREERAIQINLLNYRRDGTPFWMLFHMCPVFNKEDGRVIHFVGVQVPILQKPRRRNGVSLLYEEESRMNESVYGSCRREVCSDSLVDLGRALSLDCALDDADNRGLACFKWHCLVFACLIVDFSL